MKNTSSVTPSVCKVALTGGIASGKSLVTEYLQQCGVATLDADAVVHQLLNEDTALKAKIYQVFGQDVFTSQGEVDRNALGQRVFSDVQQRKLLESLIHPKVRERVQAFFQTHGHEKLAVAVIPLLFESGLQARYDHVWLVTATREQQVERLMQHRGMSREEAEARIQSQMPLAEKLQQLKRCQNAAIIDNTGTPEATRQQVQRLLDQWA